MGGHYVLTDRFQASKAVLACLAVGKTVVQGANVSDIERRSNAQLDRIEQKLDDRLEKFEKTLYGNGKPGLCEKVTRLEDTIRVTQWFVGIGATLVAGIVGFFDLKK